MFQDSRDDSKRASLTRTTIGDAGTRSTKYGHVTGNGSKALAATGPSLVCPRRDLSKSRSTRYSLLFGRGKTNVANDPPRNRRHRMGKGYVALNLAPGRVEELKGIGCDNQSPSSTPSTVSGFVLPNDSSIGAHRARTLRVTEDDGLRGPCEQVRIRRQMRFDGCRRKREEQRDLPTLVSDDSK